MSIDHSFIKLMTDHIFPQVYFVIVCYTLFQKYADLPEFVLKYVEYKIAQNGK